jgi:acyl phosphate:glycerol-3-phosphate acyltransferase
MALVAYLVGSVPTGYVLARLKRVDVRTVGSGNIGATNVARTAGKGLGIATLVFDAAKGALPVLVAAALAPEIHSGERFATALQCVAALGAVVGHVFSIALRFRGGKGVATALGAIAALDPSVLWAPLVVFAIAFALSRRVSLGSILAAASAPLAALLVGSSSLIVLTLVLIAAIIIARHRENIRRLQAGTEPRFSA